MREQLEERDDGEAVKPGRIEAFWDVARTDQQRAAPQIFSSCELKEPAEQVLRDYLEKVPWEVKY